MSLRSGFLRPAAIWCLYLALAVTLQWASGNYQTGFGQHTDEGMHYVTGLMVRDYVAQGFPGPPMRFAENYYLHYPAVAFGHWPPVLYIMEAFWTFLFPVSRPSMLLFMAVTTSAVALILHLTAAAKVSAVAGYFAGILYVGLPLTQFHTSMVMAEPAMALWGLLALLALTRFLNEDTLRWAMIFAVLLSTAILTKPSAWSFALATPLAFWATGNTRRLFSRNLWVAGALLAVLTIPFSVLTLKMAKAGMEHRQMSAGRTLAALAEYFRDIPACLGIAGATAALAGLGVMFLLPLYRRKRVDPLWGVLAAAGVGALLFHSIVPTAAEPRKAYLMIPPAVLLAAAAVHRLSRSAASEAAIGVGLLVLIGLQIFWIPWRPVSGFEEAVRQVRLNLRTPNTVPMISSSRAGGESAFVSDFVSTEPARPLHFVVRSNKALAKADWNMTEYHSRYSTTQQVQAALDSIPVSVVVVDTKAQYEGYPHHLLLRELLRSNTAQWQQIYSANVAGLSVDTPGTIEIYKRTVDLSDRPLRFGIDLTDKLDRSISFGK